jgi:hypothetical protein
VTAVESARFSYDLVREGTDGNHEADQRNLRLAYNLNHSDDVTTELGASIQTGRIPNDNTGLTGSHSAVSLHLDGSYGRWNLMAQFIRQHNHLRNDALLNSSPTGAFMTMGAYDAPYQVASDLDLYTVGASYTLHLSVWNLDSISFYVDYSLLDKQASGFLDTEQRVIGAAVAAGRFYTYFDFASGRNHPWLGPVWTTALASGGYDSWHTRLNVNVGYYL